MEKLWLLSVISGGGGPILLFPTSADMLGIDIP